MIGAVVQTTRTEKTNVHIGSAILNDGYKYIYTHKFIHKFCFYIKNEKIIIKNLTKK